MISHTLGQQLQSGWELLQSGTAASTETLKKGKISSILNCFPELECAALFYFFFLECICSILKCQLSLTRYKSLERGKVLGPGNGSDVVIAVCWTWSWFHRDHFQMSRRLENFEILEYGNVNWEIGTMSNHLILSVFSFIF